MSPPLDSLVEWRCLILGNGLVERGGAEGGSWHCFPKEDEELFTSNTGVEVRLVGLVTGEGSSKVCRSLARALFQTEETGKRFLRALLRGTGLPLTLGLCLLSVTRQPSPCRGWGLRWQPLRSTGLLAFFLWVGIASRTATNP